MACWLQAVWIMSLGRPLCPATAGTGTPGLGRLGRLGQLFGRFGSEKKKFPRDRHGASG